MPFEVWILVFIEELGMFGLFGARGIALVHEVILLMCCYMYRENKNATRARKMEMNEFRENECLPNLELKLKF